MERIKDNLDFYDEWEKRQEESSIYADEKMLSEGEPRYRDLSAIDDVVLHGSSIECAQCVSLLLNRLRHLNAPIYDIENTDTCISKVLYDMENDRLVADYEDAREWVRGNA